MQFVEVLSWSVHDSAALSLRTFSPKTYAGTRPAPPTDSPRGLSGRHRQNVDSDVSSVQRWQCAILALTEATNQCQHRRSHTGTDRYRTDNRSRRGDSRGHTRSKPRRARRWPFAHSTLMNLAHNKLLPTCTKSCPYPLQQP